jgi:RimJ/RimL family protein N-acetyltransferase
MHMQMKLASLLARSTTGPVTVSVHPFAAINASDWLSLLNHPNVVRHMPLTDGRWTASAVAEWTREKDAQWDRNGYGPWAIKIDGVFAGWGGFQREDNEADLALVLHPDFWGQGGAVLRALLARRAGLGIQTVSVLLPPSRTRLRGLSRLGFVSAGEWIYAGQRFLKFVLKSGETVNGSDCSVEK